ncbi:MGMT family protein [Candidatus Woesearchaeota archaeon]|nr:MGMT family protein [Candidatus Woesearchaeota archaeon]MBU3942134.1 MGMT family protein [Nanoarchaeota archaeon]
MQFNEKVLKLTKKIPRGRVTTYKIIAEKLKTKAYRAVGTALHNNKRPIIIPCHRVVNSNGFVGGYAKGIKKKTELLKKEGIKIKNKKIEYFEKILFRF